MLQHFGQGLVDIIQPVAREDLHDGITRHDMHVAAISAHAGLKLGISLGELRRVLSHREPARQDGAKADQNRVHGWRPSTQFMRKVCSIDTSV